MSTSTYPIVGISDGIGADGSRPLRYEINKFVNPTYNRYARDQLNLFLLALERIQAMSPTERLSWFQIGGIHGQPFVEWDSSRGTGNPGANQWLGYCNHASILFPTWHRLYVALIEQAVHECMKQVLSQFPQSQQAALKPAVDHWRYPYWDWALATPGSTQLVVPDLMRNPTVTVLRPNGITSTISNPMYRYALPVNSQGTINGITDFGSSAPFSRAPFTVRHPLAFDQTRPLEVQATWSQGISDNGAVQNSLNYGVPGRPGGQQVVGDVYRLFSMMRSYPPFSNAGWRGPGSVANYSSLESVHNNIHIFTGGMTWGHMSVNSVAAFDPAFWMHHGNVERQLCIFQALNPADYQSWPNDPWLSRTVEPWFTGVGQPENSGTWSIYPGTIAGTSTPLSPFHKDTYGTVYNSDDCRYMYQFGYAFEELQEWLPRYRLASGAFNQPLFVQDVRVSLNQKYGWAVPPWQLVRRIARGLPSEDLPEAEPRTLPLQERQYKEYVINVLVDRFANEGQTFAINFFLGEVPAEVGGWEKTEKLGVIAIFGGNQFASGNCSNCTSQAEHEETRLVTGQISITSALMDLIDSKKDVLTDTLPSLDKDTVGEFLKKHLHWRVSKMGNTEFELEELPSLKVSVAVATATLPVEEDEFVQYGDFEVIDAPTRGRLCGFDLLKDRI